MYFGKQFSLVFYEQLTRVVGMLVVICWPLWMFVRSKVAKSKGEDDVELGFVEGDNGTSVQRSRGPEGQIT